MASGASSVDDTDDPSAKSIRKRKRSAEPRAGTRQAGRAEGGTNGRSSRRRALPDAGPGRARSPWDRPTGRARRAPRGASKATRRRRARSGRSNRRAGPATRGSWDLDAVVLRPDPTPAAFPTRLHRHRRQRWDRSLAPAPSAPNSSTAAPPGSGPEERLTIAATSTPSPRASAKHGPRRRVEHQPGEQMPGFDVVTPGAHRHSERLGQRRLRSLREQPGTLGRHRPGIFASALPGGAPPCGPARA